MSQERNLALGNTSRTPLAAHMTGLQLLFADLRTKPHCECYLRGAARMNRGLFKMHIVAAVAPGPTEEGLAMLCEDDRPFLQVKFEFSLAILSGVRCLHLPRFVRRLGCHDRYRSGSGEVNWVPSECHTRVSVFSSWCVLDKWKGHPWCTFAGDATVKLEQKLDELSAHEAKPQEELDGQMWTSLRFNLLPRYQFLYGLGRGRNAAVEYYCCITKHTPALLRQ